MKPKKRLIITAGTFTTAVSAALIRQLKDKDTENYLVSVAPFLYENLDEHIREEAGKLGVFKQILFYFDFCAPKKQYKDEKSHILSFDFNKFKESTDNIEFDEIISVYIHGAAHNLINKYPKAKLYYMEDGTASYLKMENSEILDKRAKKIYTLNYFDKVKPHVALYGGVKTEKIIPEILREVFDEISANLKISTTPCEKSVIFCAQNISINPKAMSFKNELKLYENNIKKLLRLGYRVYFKEHPKTPNMFFKHLKPLVNSKELINLGPLATHPIEVLTASLKPDAIVSMFSSALFTVPMLYSIPAFTFFADDEFIKHQIFLVAHLLTASYIPPIEMMTQSPEETKKAFYNFLKTQKPIEKQAIYNIKMFDYFKLFISRSNFNRIKKEFRKCHKFLLKYAQIPDEVIKIFENQSYIDFLLHYSDNYIKSYRIYTQKATKNINFSSTKKLIADGLKLIGKLIL